LVWLWSLSGATLRWYSAFYFLRSVTKTLRFFNEQSLTTFSQKEQVEESGFTDPPGIHLIPLPFADDIRAAPIQEAFRGMRYHHTTSESHFYSLS